MSSHQWTPTNNGLVLLPNTILLEWNYFLSSVVTNGTDGNGLKFEKMRLNFSKRVDIKLILNGHGLFSLNEIKLIRSFKCSNNVGHGKS